MSLINIAFKKIYRPLCRIYSNHLGDKPADAFLHFLCSIEFRRIYHYWPNFIQPKRFSEKIWSRQLHIRDPIFTVISDKFRVRDYIAENDGSNYLIPLLWDGEDPEKIPFNDLPSKFVIKANHGCGYNIIVTDKRAINWIEIMRKIKKWLNSNFCIEKYLGIAWGYKNIKPHIIIESFLSENGKAPVDYKFFCFSGKMEFFKIDFNRFEGHSEKFYNRELEELNLFEEGLKLYTGETTVPDNFKEMVYVAENLAKKFNFMRVDLYNVNSKIYFSELTPYPGGSSMVFKPAIYDFIFGEKWK